MAKCRVLGMPLPATAAAAATVRGAISAVEKECNPDTSVHACIAHYASSNAAVVMTQFIARSSRTLAVL